jgi:hypothetical protein
MWLRTAAQSVAATGLHECGAPSGRGGPTTNRNGGGLTLTEIAIMSKAGFEK